tara:strand:- start:369 stop:623 length:255 start_codon:yes stop_codon:yes gene_type:complete
MRRCRFQLAFCEQLFGFFAAAWEDGAATRTICCQHLEPEARNPNNPTPNQGAGCPNPEHIPELRQRSDIKKPPHEAGAVWEEAR